MSWPFLSKAQVQWRKARRHRRFRTLQRRAPRAALKVAGRRLGRGILAVLAGPKRSATEQRGCASKASGEEDEDEDQDQDHDDHYYYYHG